MLERAADLLEADLPRLLGLLAREAGKTYPNAIAEVREAVDFLRYYAAEARRDFTTATHVPLGPVVCISPWNFPLAIFTGQIAAALVAGNPVLAKPAEQTPLIAAEMVRRLWQAGVPRAALQLLPGPGETIGAALVGDARVQGVMFTGSTEVARLLQKSLAARLNRDGRPVPLIAETGGQNAMLVDSSALAEQVVTDVVASAFDSAGQRCSALRVLCLQEDGADAVLAMLKGAMAESRIGDPATLAVDVGPVIDAEARAAHRGAHRADARQGQGGLPARRAAAPMRPRAGTFVVPTLIELERLGELEREVFGPVLHVVRYRRAELAAMIEQINATGYGLTLGVHSRIDETIARVVAAAHVGNVYVNRNMIGAVVGVQPFGGEGLSGTGPKAGGPLYLYRLLARRPADAMARALALAEDDARRGDRAGHARARAAARAAGVGRAAGRARAGRALRGASPDCRAPARRASCAARPASATSTRCARARPCSASPRNDVDRLVQLAAVLAVGSRALWPSDAAAAARAPARGGAGRDRARRRLDRAGGPLRRRPPPRQRRRAARRSCRRLASARRSDRRRRGASAGRDGDRARAAGGRARAQHQHRGRGRQRDADDAAMTSTAPSLRYATLVRGARRDPASPIGRAEPIERHVRVGGSERSYLVDLPPGYDAQRALPAVLVFHGGGGAAAVGADADADEREGPGRGLHRRLSARLGRASRRAF